MQGRAHLEAFAAGLPRLRAVRIASRSRSSAQLLADRAAALGLEAQVADDADAALADCPLVVTCTPASSHVLAGLPRGDAFLAAIGAFTPQMAELAPALCRHVAAQGLIVLDSDDARHEAGDLLQAGIDPSGLPTLQTIRHQDGRKPRGPVLFKSCGWAGWDLAAARLAATTARG